MGNDNLEASRVMDEIVDILNASTLSVMEKIGVLSTIMVQGVRLVTEIIQE